MGPLFHILSNFVMVWLVSAAMGLEFAGPVFVLALFGGLFPDFTHHYWEFVLAAGVSFGAAYMFAVERMGDAGSAAMFGLLMVLILLYIRSNSVAISQKYRDTPRSKWTVEMFKETKLTYSVPYYVAFGLAAFLFTQSIQVGIVAFLCYWFHGTIDYVTYATKWGLRNMAPYSKI